MIAPDQMGHGGTADDIKRPFDVHAMAEDTVSLLGQLGVTRAAFVGWSDGANIALDIAMNHPALASAVVATGANSSVSGIDPAMLKIVRAMKSSDWPPEIVDAYVKDSPDGKEHLPALFDRVRKMWLSEPNWSAKDLARIKARTMIVAGDHDAISLAHTGAHASAIAGSELAILPHASHEVPLEDPARWNALVLAFLTEPPATKTP